MICRQCQRPTARRGLCWSHYRAYLRDIERAYELNAMAPEMRRAIFDFQASFAKLLAVGFVEGYRNLNVLPFAGLSHLVTTGVDHA